MVERSDDLITDVICVIDDDQDVRCSLDSLLRANGYQVRTFASPDEFLASGDDAGCLVLDIQLQDANGLDFQQQLLASEATIPVILMSGHGDIPMTVRGMKAGAVTFLTKPFSEVELMAAVGEALAKSRRLREQGDQEAGLRARYGALSGREREVMGLVAAGLMNKQVAARLGLSEITVKIHRGNLMRKMHCESLADLVRLAETLGVREMSVSRYHTPPTAGPSA
jgi:FixJ family two-component response regulator